MHSAPPCRQLLCQTQQTPEVEYSCHFIGLDWKKPFKTLQGRCLNKMKFSVPFSSDFCWQSNRSFSLSLKLTYIHTHTHTHTSTHSSLDFFCQFEMPQCLLAVLEWWGKEETFQPMLLRNPEQDKEMSPRLLLLVLVYPFSFITLSKVQEKTQKNISNKAWCISDRILKASGLTRNTKLFDDQHIRHLSVMFILYQQRAVYVKAIQYLKTRFNMVLAWDSNNLNCQFKH